MKQWLMIAGVSVVLAACGGDEKTAEVEVEVEKTEVSVNTVDAVIPVTPVPIDASDMKLLSGNAKTAVKSLAGILQGDLQKAMKSGGPVNALSVCNIRAPEIAGTVSSEQKMQVSRVSLKNRNPDMGQPSKWQTKVLEEFESRKAGGEKPITLTYSEVVEQGGQQEFRFMKAIPTGKLCLVCHGTSISPAVQKKITELYPQDKAIGYKEGDLRGAFVVVQRLH
uniref:Glutamate synthase n=1 Tax=uncultured Thiotrichaceae bacterium TaxID=298394 RepID=A0A6S6SW73_9GAMM|nr:MAG: Glutamate synthase [uncultured Thiotrichaceae bacterium]